jgi:hypothetical protein
MPSRGRRIGLASTSAGWPYVAYVLDPDGTNLEAAYRSHHWTALCRSPGPHGVPVMNVTG